MEKNEGTRTVFEAVVQVLRAYNEEAEYWRERAKEAKRPRARWASSHPLEYEVCSNCRNRVMALALTGEIGDTIRTPFCPWCGAQMENTDEEAEE